MKHLRKASFIPMTALAVGALLSLSPVEKGVSLRLASREADLYNAPSVTVTLGEFASYMEGKEEHYPLSDEFIEKYQQTSGGYIDLAKKRGIPVDKTIHSPNQKWHFFDSWLAEGQYDMSLDAYRKVYIDLKCPELVLWIYEACGVNPAKVSMAKKEAEEGRAHGVNVTTIASRMRQHVAWEDLMEHFHE